MAATPASRRSGSLQGPPTATSRWFEEPVSSDDLDGLRRVREAVPADVAAGEYGCDLTYFERMSAAGAVDCLQADASRCGGITEWLRVAAVAAAHHLEISGHCAPHLHVHAAAAIPNLRHLEWFHDHVRIETCSSTAPSIRPAAPCTPIPPSPAAASPPDDVIRRYQVGDTVRRATAGREAPVIGLGRTRAGQQRRQRAAEPR